MNATWNEAMEWWKSNRHANLIQRVATHLLIREVPEGCGIGSSDVNHKVHSLYLDYKGEGSPNLVGFLVERFNQ